MDQENNISGTAFTFMVIECKTNPETIGCFVKRNAIHMTDQSNLLIDNNLTLTNNFAEAVTLIPSMKIPIYTMFQDIWSLVNEINERNNGELIIAPVPLIIRDGICITRISTASEEELKEIKTLPEWNQNQRKQSISKTTPSRTNMLDFTQPWGIEDNELY